MTKFKVSVSVEEGAILSLEAKNKQEAEELAIEILSFYGGVNYPKEYNAETVHRDYMVIDIKE